MEQTTNYGLNKPGGSDYARIDVLNANMDAVDAALKDLEESKAEGAALAAHEADGVKHVSAAERTAWNAKADGTATGAHIARTDNPPWGDGGPGGGGPHDPEGKRQGPQRGRHPGSGRRGGGGGQPQPWGG